MAGGEEGVLGRGVDCEEGSDDTIKKAKSLEWRTLRAGSRHRGDVEGEKCYLISLCKDLSGCRAGLAEKRVQRRGKGATIF